MGSLPVAILQIGVLAGSLALLSQADADALVVGTKPSSAWQEAATLEVVVSGSGFGIDSAIRFLVSGTDKLGGIVVSRVRFKNPKELIAVLEISPSAVVGAYDVEVNDTLGGTTRAENVFVVEPYSWAGRFGCSGAESWRQRIPCRRGTID